MLFQRSQRAAPRVLALTLAVSLPLSGRAEAAAPAPAKKRGAAPASGRGTRKVSVFQTYLNAAKRLYENLEYEQALEKLERAKRYVRGMEDDVILSLYEGVILADLGRKEPSQAAFRAGLLLKPDATLPVRASPKVERDFEAVREEVRRELATLQAQQDAEQPSPADEDPEPSQPPEAAQPPAPLAQAGRAPLTPTPAVELTAEPPAPRSKVLPYALLGGGTAAVGAGVFLGLSALSFNDAKARMTANEALEARSTASTKLTAGTVMVGGGLALLGTGLVLLLRSEPASPASSGPGASLQLAPLPGGFAVGTTGRF